MRGSPAFGALRNPSHTRRAPEGSSGGSVPPGVYLCRLTAGSLRDQKQVVLLPWYTAGGLPGEPARERPMP